MKKKISLILSLIMIACTVFGYNMPVMAIDTTWQNDFEYSISGDNIVLRRYTGTAENLVIPATAEIDGVVYNVKLNDDCSGFFHNNTTIKSIEFEDGIDASGVTDMNGMFYHCRDLKSIIFNDIDTSNVVSMKNMFSLCVGLEQVDLENLDTNSVTDMQQMFYACQNIERIDLSGFDTSNVTNMGSMFAGCLKLNSLNIANIDTSSVTDMNSMFSGCKKMTSINLRNFITTNVTDMSCMFSGCSNLRSINLSSFYTRKVKYMDYMFSECSSIETLDLSSFDMRNVSGTTGVFNECYNLVKIKTPIKAKYGITIPDGFCDSEDFSVKYSCLPYEQQNSITIIKYFAVSNVYLYPKDSSTIYYNRISSKKINLGDSFALKADVQPRNATNPDIVWSSNNSNVATVDSEGNVVGVGLGTASIRATSVENNEIYASCYFTVTTPVSGIQLSPETKTISTGNSFKILPCITPQNAIDTSVTWNSENPDIAIVDDDGNVTAISEGVTTITATTTDGGFVAQCIVTVTKPVEGIIVSPESCKIDIGDTCSLSAEVTPDGADLSVVWSSSDDSIARVDENGMVTGIKVGTVTITATTVDGNMTDQCSVRVVDPNDTTWQNNFNYSLYDGKIILYEYIGTVEELVIPSTARIDGKVYNVALMSDCSRLFANDNKLKSVVFEDINTSNVTNMSSMFSGCVYLKNVDLSGLDTSSVTDMSYLFSGCSNLNSIDFGNIDTRNVTNMSGMFRTCVGLKSLDLSFMDTSSVTILGNDYYPSGGIFSGCSNLAELNIEGWNTSNVTAMGYMFYGCSKLTDLDLSGMNTSNVVGMKGMFQNCSSLQNLDLSGFTTNKVTDMGGLFSGCSSLKSIDVSDFDTSNVTNMNGMFSDCSALQSLDLTDFDTGNVTNMGSMFSGCRNLHSIDLSSFNMCYVYESTYMFGFNWNSGIEEITIPLNLESEVSLPYTFCDKDDYTKEYNTLPTNKTTSFAIVKKTPVSGIAVSPTRKTINVDDSFEITAIISPVNATNKNVIWSSDNPSVASVDSDGNVKGVLSGKTYINAITEEGSYVSRCEVTVSVPIHYHNWGNPTYTWSSDNKQCTATRVCQNDASHVETETVDVMTAIVTPATTSTMGTTQYKAVFNNTAFSTQTKQLQDIPVIQPEQQQVPQSVPTQQSTNQNNNTSVKPSSQSTKTDTGIPMYRLYNPNSGEHFYTANKGEMQSLDSVGWNYEGIAWYAPSSGTPVYRMYNPNVGDHHYTMNWAEVQMLQAAGWNYEGEAWKSGGSVKMLRAYNPNAVTGTHHYTSNRAEINMIVAAGWRDEGYGWYALR